MLPVKTAECSATSENITTVHSVHRTKLSPLLFMGIQSNNMCMTKPLDEIKRIQGAKPRIETQSIKMVL